MKILYKFNVNKIEHSEQPVEKTDASGAVIKVLEKVEKTVPQTYGIRKPSRNDWDESEFFHDKLFSEYIRAGFLTRSEVIKRFTDENVIVKKVYQEYEAKESEIQRLELQEKTEENILRQNKAKKELVDILVSMHDFVFSKSSVFDRTAENRARIKTLFWWVLRLSYKLDGDKEIPVFNGETFEDKVKQYDEMTENNDDHIKEVIGRFSYFISAWYVGDLKSEEDFKKSEDLLNAEIQKQKEKPADGEVQQS